MWLIVAACSHLQYINTSLFLVLNDFISQRMLFQILLRDLLSNILDFQHGRLALEIISIFVNWSVGIIQLSISFIQRRSYLLNCLSFREATKESGHPWILLILWHINLSILGSSYRCRFLPLIFVGLMTRLYNLSNILIWDFVQFLLKNFFRWIIEVDVDLFTIFSHGHLCFIKYRDRGCLLFIVLVVNLLEYFRFMGLLICLMLNILISSHSLFLQINVEGYQMAKKKHWSSVEKYHHTQYYREISLHWLLIELYSYNMRSNLTFNVDYSIYSFSECVCTMTAMSQALW